MVTKKGNVEVKIDGQIYGFRIGTWTFRQAQLSLGVNSVNAVLEKIGLLNGQIDVDAYLTFLFEAAVEYKRVMGIEIPKNFSTVDIADWVDVMGGVSGSLMTVVEGLKHYLPKNEEAPTTELMTASS